MKLGQYDSKDGLAQQQKMLDAREQGETEQARAVVRSITEGVIGLDEKQCVVTFNPAAEQMLDISAHAIKGQPLASMADMGDEDSRKRARLLWTHLSADLEAAKDAGGVHTSVLELDEPPQTIVVKLSPLTDDNGCTSGQLIVLHNMSVEASLSEAKTDFIATISHELRTPLTLIFGNLDLLLRGYVGDLNDEQSDMLTQVRKRANDISVIVKNMILIASIQSNSVTIEFQPQDLLLIVESVLEPMSADFAAKGIAVTKAIPADLPLLHTDRELLRLILSQLLDNARRFTRQGEVTISACQEQGRVRVDIADTGIGLTPEAQRRLFTRFQRIDGNISSERGVGLGLAITRQIVERLNGEIWATSTPGEGSVFSFALPALGEH